MPKRINWANVLTWSRLGLVIPITIAALLDMRWSVFCLFVVAALTDFFDGRVARWTGVASEQGAELDSRVDIIVAAFVFLWLRLLFPAFFAEFWRWIVAIAVLIGVQLGVAHQRLGRAVGLHLWSAKLAALCVAALLASLSVFDYVPWMAWTVITVSIYSLVEGLAYLLKGGKNLDARFFWDE